MTDFEICRGGVRGRRNPPDARLPLRGNLRAVAFEPIASRAGHDARDGLIGPQPADHSHAGIGDNRPGAKHVGDWLLFHADQRAGIRRAQVTPVGHQRAPRNKHTRCALRRPVEARQLLMDFALVTVHALFRYQPRQGARKRVGLNAGGLLRRSKPGDFTQAAGYARVNFCCK